VQPLDGKMDLEELIAWLGKALLASIVLIAAIVWGAYWWSNTPPGRPSGVAPHAVWIWAPSVPVPRLPRPGTWIACQKTSTSKDFVCSLWNESARKTYEGTFVAYPKKDSVGVSTISIDTHLTGSRSAIIGDAVVPVIYLENGPKLIPLEAYDRLVESVH